MNEKEIRTGGLKHRPLRDYWPFCNLIKYVYDHRPPDDMLNEDELIVKLIMFNVFAAFANLLIWFDMKGWM
jgi:hypothetical protein